jgi:hypothetical protein
MFPGMMGKSSTFRSHGARKNLLEVARAINISSPMERGDEKAFSQLGHFVR